ncbi:hypothetical protein CLAFUW4_09620 [Fulvia fulva]|uniref:Uncharacterized protein n=1 Tax=Passalora fulva TaxID=5499 RepID=A0A9Q8UTF5_PASFU|nr:uncharacterized protein CLAFUR5_09714 [Fulvia fulva]KAK4614093.1 hypothetical protein CLAFUR4_09625 [Fulvia fulva]KAK4615168.1 hypothetical protein CLAFUR0_09616 [Fulvia fulva]UJO21894.1 hypothetical protein CLAFUR5_09714 [Fulvia fulva]WPV20630.1 hypothetical protein CLAFUW4_09620 [Fulvia fulva]WPV35759.1 hypothetical protein CLAFUW7_09621 [Fulvia fulva]
MQAATTGAKRCWDWVKDYSGYEETSRKALKHTAQTSPSSATLSASKLPGDATNKTDSGIEDSAGSQPGKGEALMARNAAQREVLEPYIFDANEGPDYVAGPSFVVNTGSAGNQLPAILLTEELSNILQEAAIATRDLREATSRRDAQAQILDRFRSWSLDQQRKLLRLRDTHEGVEGGEKVRRQLQLKVREYDRRIREVRDQKASYKKQIADLEQRADAANKVAALAIEDVLVRGNLLSGQVQGKTDEDIAFERKYAVPKDNDESHTMVLPDDDPEQASEHRQSPESEVVLNPAAVHKAQVIGRYREATDMMERARVHFNNRHENCQPQHTGRGAGSSNSASSQESPTEKDLKVLQRHRQLTRQLVEAEEAFSEAKREAKAVGFATTSEASSDDSSQSEATAEPGADYRSWCDVVTIQAWINTLPSKTESRISGVGGYAQEAKAIRNHEHDHEVGVGECESTFAECGENQKALRRWKQYCEGLRVVAGRSVK